MQRVSSFVAPQKEMDLCTDGGIFSKGLRTVNPTFDRAPMAASFSDCNELRDGADFGDRLK
jgi:hypothetical protein